MGAWNSQFSRIRVYVNSLSTRGPDEYLLQRYNGYLGPRITIILPPIVVAMFHMHVSPMQYISVREYRFLWRNIWNDIINYKISSIFITPARSER